MFVCIFPLTDKEWKDYQADGKGIRNKKKNIFGSQKVFIYDFLLIKIITLLDLYHLSLSPSVIL